MGSKLYKLTFSLSQSLKSCVSEGIQAVDDRMTKQEDIRRKKVQQINYYLRKIILRMTLILPLTQRK